jgi:hypothetical protein
LGTEHFPVALRRLSAVIAGLDPAIHDALLQTQSVLCAFRVIMDARVKPGHDQSLIQSC